MSLKTQIYERHYNRSVKNTSINYNASDTLFNDIFLLHIHNLLTK